MHSIPGDTLHEVFFNIAADPRYSAAERVAAATVAAEEAAEIAHQLACNALRAKHELRYCDEMDPPEPVRHTFRTTVPQGVAIQCGGFRFVVLPYTTGRTMNVGVDEWE
jgi:hypothetical protein